MKEKHLSPPPRMRVFNFVVHVLVPDQISLFISWYSLPPCFEVFLMHVKSWERVGFCIQHYLVEWEDVVGSKQEVEVFKSLGLNIVSLGVSRETKETVALTSQKDSILSLLFASTLVTSLREVKPPPFSTIVYLTNASNISHPHSL